MTRPTDQPIEPDSGAKTRLLRLERYRSLQLCLERERRQRVARDRLLTLHGNPWGWLPL